MHLFVNHYPPCPDPSLTLGITKHYDPNLLTILHQEDVNDLQIFNNEEWIGVEPLHNAFVVNIGNQLQIISNNKLKSGKHLVVTNSRVAQTTTAFFIAPSEDSIIESAISLVGEVSIYRAFEYKDFLLDYLSYMGNNEVVLGRFESQSLNKVSLKYLISSPPLFLH
ncbi:protein DMR6-LIKE OXYGENASE 1-like [Gossypium australe]|uniref:Protein DMR6-LIKE OXYGENASE 1-like n=1 Tax=Gossypium australe TaxID=47621 RepID=A0A5B6UMU9_9ROSI|nr:protein DMR6-LIKE OXYGENASE 1-like [Gossypium australe]